MATLRNRELLDLIVGSISESGWNCLIIDTNKPFRLRIYDKSSKVFEVAVYIWNCTHGGGTKRAADEYRIQLTGVIPQRTAGVTTAILGWHEGYGVFAGFDIDWHINQNSQSPSIQIKEETLKAAHKKAFSVSQRQNGELAVAFRPEFLVDYILNSRSLHEQGISSRDLSLLNDLSTANSDCLADKKNIERETVISTIARKYRAADFRGRVLSAYQHRCAFCGVQLKLIDAAHIIPVASEASTDETVNGIALCKLHHFAYDRNLVSFNADYTVEVSSSEQSRLAAKNLAGGFGSFKKSLLTAIILPADKRDYPSTEYITKSRKIRRWTP
ncbi:HNH endonuclease [Comamonas sp. 17RB]|uniref:HNH endonuclease n=1 Tax=Comamonas sp. 17RB TaxID=3047025 RepID=UPI0024B68A95|nr:HNH endonuclease [Comamonas sp. 17RB]MDI9854292.1 HNH endonuclease [Comamonas sp. 17RB]